MNLQPHRIFCGAPLALGLALVLGSAGAQNAPLITGYQDSDSPRALSAVPGRSERQSITATFLIQGDDLPLNSLTVSHLTTLRGSRDLTWLRNSDAGYQARLLLNTTFAAQIDGAPAQADASGALQSLINTAAAQGYTTIPSGSYLKFVHVLEPGTLPVMQKNVVQIVDSYTLQNAALGLGSSSDGVGVLRGPATPPKPAPAKAPALPAKTPAVPRSAAPAPLPTHPTK